MIPVVFITDNNYVLATVVAITSLIKNKLPTTIYEINVICNGVNAESRQILRSLEQDKVKINLIMVENIQLDQYRNPTLHVLPTALLKFSIADLLPQYDKVLYLDDDILVLQDLTAFYEVDLQDTYAGAVRDMPTELYRDHNILFNLDKYFNSGVMLLNTKRIRQEGLPAIMYDKKATHPEYCFMDQDVLNVIFKGEVTWLPPDYNCIYVGLAIPSLTIEKINTHYDTAYKSFDDLLKQTVILHLAGPIKPWIHHSDVIGGGGRYIHVLPVFMESVFSLIAVKTSSNLLFKL